MANFLFYFLSAIAVLAGMGVILARNPVGSTLSLLTAFLSLAVIYLLAGFQLLAAMQILVYAGAIMVLFLFVVMLLNLGDPEEAERHDDSITFNKQARAGVAVAAGLLFAICVGILGAQLPPPELRAAELGIDNARALASWMFGRYVLPFEAISVLLLATAVGVLVLAKRERGRTVTESADEEAQA